jgi:hypothetical protein
LAASFIYSPGDREDLPPAYRVKSTSEGHKRMAREDDLQLAGNSGSQSGAYGRHNVKPADKPDIRDIVPFVHRTDRTGH